MDIAVYTKPILIGNETKAKLLSGLSAINKFNVFEIKDVQSDIKADRLLVFGGDGTMLYAAKRSPVPVLGVNLGNIGFLAELEADVTVEKLTEVLESGKVIGRFMLSEEREKESSLALNEVTIKSTDARPIMLNLFIDDEFVDSYHSDGIIISTPTGSTAYSLSAGGPVLEPTLNAIIINPVCPHSLHSRPLVINSDAKVKLELVSGKASVVIDGDSVSTLNTKDTLSVHKCDRDAKFVVSDGRNFYKKLLQKMNRWGVTQ